MPFNLGSWEKANRPDSSGFSLQTWEEDNPEEEKVGLPGIQIKKHIPLVEAIGDIFKPKPREQPTPIYETLRTVEPIPAPQATTEVAVPSLRTQPTIRPSTEEEKRVEAKWKRPRFEAPLPDFAERFEKTTKNIYRGVQRALQPGDDPAMNAIKGLIRFGVGIPEFILEMRETALEVISTSTPEESARILEKKGREMIGSAAHTLQNLAWLISYSISPITGGSREEYERRQGEFLQDPSAPVITAWIAKAVGRSIGKIPKGKMATKARQIVDYAKSQDVLLKRQKGKEVSVIPTEKPTEIPAETFREFVESRGYDWEIMKKSHPDYPLLIQEYKKVHPKVSTLPPEEHAYFREPALGPGIMGGVSSIGQEASVQRIMGALKEARPLRKEQEALYTKERGAKLAKSLAIRKTTTGEAGFYAEKGQFTGEMAKVTFESIRSKISQADIDNLFNKVRDSAYLTEFEKLTAREGLVKMFGEHGGRVPTKGELTLLEQIFPAEFIKTVMEKRPLWEKFKEAGWQLANIPRSVMASFDLSFGARQGAFAAPRYRKQFWDSWKAQFKIFGSEKAYQASRQALTKHPDFMFAKQGKVSFTELGKIMTQREEAFMSQWAEKIPLVGRGIRASSRAYTSFANKYRLDIFSRMVKDAEGMGFNPRKNPLLAKKIADFVNNATGRGHLGSFESSAVALNALFFSPRLNMARMKLLNPVYYIKQPKFVRMEALKTALTASGTAVTILTLADLMGAEVGWNPLSADFGKIKIRNTRIDMLAGFGQFMRAGAQLIMGRTISTTTGKETILGEGYKPRTRLDIFLQQVEYKESPIASFATTLLKGKDFAGRDVSIPKEVGRRFVPMVVADVVELAKEDPRLLPLGVLGVFGVGLQTYAHPYDKFVKIEKQYGRGGAEWQRAKKEFEESGFKFNIKAYLDYKKGEKEEPISRAPKTEEVIYAGMLPGMSIIDKPLMRIAGKIMSKVVDLIKTEPQLGPPKPPARELEYMRREKALPDNPTGKIPFYTEHLGYTKYHPEVADSLVSFAEQINFDKIVEEANKLTQWQQTRQQTRWEKENAEHAKVLMIASVIEKAGFTYPEKVGLFTWGKYSRLHKAPIKERKAICTATTDLFYVFGKAAGLDVKRAVTASGLSGHARNLVKIGGKWKSIDVTAAFPGDRPKIVIGGGIEGHEPLHTLENYIKSFPHIPGSEETYFNQLLEWLKYQNIAHIAADWVIPTIKHQLKKIGQK